MQQKNETMKCLIKISRRHLGGPKKDEKVEKNWTKISGASSFLLFPAPQICPEKKEDLGTSCIIYDRGPKKAVVKVLKII